MPSTPGSYTPCVVVQLPPVPCEVPLSSLSVHGHISASGFVVAQGFVNKFLENNVAAAGSGQGDATVIGTNLYQRGTQNIFVEGSDAAKGVRLPSIQTISKQYSASIQGANHGPGTGWNGQDGGNATGLTYQIVNTSDEALKVYPSNAQKILPLSANAPVVIPGYNKCEFLLSGSGDHGSWWSWSQPWSAQRASAALQIAHCRDKKSNGEIQRAMLVTGTTKNGSSIKS